MKRYFYALSFIFNDASGRTVNGCSYMGWPTRNVTIPRLLEARRAQGFPDTACLIGVSYLGYMTKAEMIGEDEQSRGAPERECPHLHTYTPIGRPSICEDCGKEL